MYKICTICKRGYHTGVSHSKTCDRVECKELYIKRHKINPQRGRRIRKFRSSEDAEANLIRAAAKAKELGVDYGTYIAFKERGWQFKKGEILY